MQARMHACSQSRPAMPCTQRHRRGIVPAGGGRDRCCAQISHANGHTCNVSGVMPLQRLQLVQGLLAHAFAYDLSRTTSSWYYVDLRDLYSAVQQSLVTLLWSVIGSSITGSCCIGWEGQRFACA